MINQGLSSFLVEFIDRDDFEIRKETLVAFSTRKSKFHTNIMVAGPGKRILYHFTPLNECDKLSDDFLIIFPLLPTMWMRLNVSSVMPPS